MVSGDNNKEYTVTAHMKSVDQDNLGVSHFGIHPEYLRRENIRFDIFHLRSPIIRRLMIYWGKFMMLQTKEIMDEYTQLMKLFWTDFHIEVWNLNKAFTSFKGVDIKEFISNIPNMINFIKTKYTTS
eukprot:scaffold202834_cov44-Attheya_sp.AAC.1